MLRKSTTRLGVPLMTTPVRCFFCTCVKNHISTWTSLPATKCLPEEALGLTHWQDDTLTEVNVPGIRPGALYVQ